MLLDHVKLKDLDDRERDALAVLRGQLAEIRQVEQGGALKYHGQELARPQSRYGGEPEGLDATRLTMLSRNHDLVAAHVAQEDVGDFSVTEPGWYAVDDGKHVVLGPFVSLAECERNIRDHERTQTLKH